MVLKLILQFISSFSCAFLFAYSLWKPPKILADYLNILIQGHLSFNLYLLIIALLGIPIGSTVGSLCIDRLFFKSSVYSVKVTMFSFVFAFLGMVIMVIIRFLGEGGELNWLTSFIRSDIFIIVAIIVAGLLSVIGGKLKVSRKLKVSGTYIS